MLVWGLGLTEQKGDHLGREDPGWVRSTSEQPVFVHTDSQSM